jgi:SAM-dependent methyltransferase
MRGWRNAGLFSFNQGAQCTVLLWTTIAKLGQATKFHIQKDTMISTSAAVTPERIMQFAWGYIPTFVLEAAVHHRVFDVLDAGPKTLKETAAATGASERGLGIIMNVLVGLNFLAKTDGQRYALTPESEAFLVSTKPGFHGGILRHTSGQLIPKWLQLNEVVGSGKPATAVNQEGAGSDFFQKFVVDIFPMSYPSSLALAKHLALDNSGTPIRVLDLAAGSGVWGIALAQSSEKVTVTAVDWVDVLPATRKTVERFGLADRFAFVAGDLLTADFGCGHNVATLGHILHSEGEARSRSLLRRVFEALAPGGTIAIAEFLVNEDRTGPVMPLLFAANMLVNTDDGDTFSFGEIRGWLMEAGFNDARLLEAPGPSPLILATKP